MKNSHKINIQCAFHLYIQNGSGAPIGSFQLDSFSSDKDKWNVKLTTHLYSFKFKDVWNPLYSFIAWCLGKKNFTFHLDTCLDQQ
jgi:hypothetical protein